MIEVEAPDGSIVEFPAGTPRDVMQRAMQQRFGSDGQALATSEDRPGLAEGLARSVGQGLTFGFGDEIEAGVRAPFSDRSYGEIRDGIRDRMDQFREDRPVAAYGSEIASSALVPGALAARAAQAGVGLGRSVAGAAGLSGAAYGAGTAENVEDIPAEAAKGAGAGLAFGTVSTAAGPVARAAARRIPESSGLMSGAAAIAAGDPTYALGMIAGPSLRKWGHQEAARSANTFTRAATATGATTAATGTSSKTDAEKRRERQKLERAIEELALIPDAAPLLDAIMGGAR